MSGFKPNRNFEAQLQKDPRYHAFFIEVAEQLAEGTKDAMRPFSKTGEFEDSIEASAGRAGTTSHIWHIIEYGSRNNPAYAPFRRAVRALGLRFKDHK